MDQFIVAVMHAALDKEYYFHSDDVRHAPQEPFFKAIVLQHWNPRAGEGNSIPEARRWYNERWISYFRVSREAFYELLEKIQDKLQPREATFGPEPLSPAEQLAVCLYWLAQGGQYKATADAMNRSKSTVYRCVVRAAEFRNLAGQRFGGKGMPHIIGAIDGSHIPIFKPSGSGDEYVNRKGTYSILLQGTVDASGKFTDVLVGWSGRIHDCKMLRHSPLGQALLPDVGLDNGPQPQNPYKLAMQAHNTRINGQKVPMMLIADSAYPAVPHILPAFKQSQANTPDKRRFNIIHALTRGPVERSYGWLKMRNRVLLRPM